TVSTPGGVRTGTRVAVDARESRMLLQREESWLAGLAPWVAEPGEHSTLLRQALLDIYVLRPAARTGGGMDAQVALCVAPRRRPCGRRAGCRRQPRPRPRRARVLPHGAAARRAVRGALPARRERVTGPADTTVRRARLDPVGPRPHPRQRLHGGPATDRR